MSGWSSTFTSGQGTGDCSYRLFQKHSLKKAEGRAQQQDLYFQPRSSQGQSGAGWQNHSWVQVGEDTSGHQTAGTGPAGLKGLQNHVLVWVEEGGSYFMETATPERT